MNEKNISATTLANMKRAGDKIATLTCYDAAFTRVLEDAGIEMLLVGDSLGMVFQGQASTVPVSVDQMVYHSACVARSRRRALLVADLPFLSYRSPDQALENSARLMQEGGAQMVKLEGAGVHLETVHQLASQGVPVCGHLGLLPQSVHRLGGYRVQGRSPDQARQIHQDALALQDAGASLLVLECMPAALATQITQDLRIPTIGIGAGAGCDGQVLVLYDLIGISAGVGHKPVRFVKNFLTAGADVRQAVANYVAEVKAGTFPGREHEFES